jgi:hypothetical protein
MVGTEINVTEITKFGIAVLLRRPWPGAPVLNEALYGHGGWGCQAAGGERSQPSQA